jgi:proteic killer suppression protein
VSIIFSFSKMKIIFGNRKLWQLATNQRLCEKELGALRSKIYLLRLQQLHDACSLMDLENLPGKFHELKGNRKGQWSCNLDQPHRLVFELKSMDNLPIEKSRKQTLIVNILEIVNYHGK